MNRNAAVIAVGNEVVHGFIVSSNTTWLAQALAEIGFDVRYHMAITDRVDEIAPRLKAALDEGLLVVTTGGIGPTVDDRTREAAAAALGVPLKLDLDDLARLHERYAAMGRRFPEGSERQCMRPEGSRLILNAFGTASCFLARRGEGGIASLPGVPREMKGVWAEELRKAVIEEFGLPVQWHTRELRIFGIPESDLDIRVKDLLEIKNAEGAILVDDAVIRLRWRVTAESDSQADSILQPVLHQARQRLGDLVFAVGDVSLEQATVSLLAERGLTVACAESCTGGMIAHLLTNVPGASDVLIEGAVTYTEDAKHRLGVHKKTLREHGAVSSQTAEEMARGIKKTGGAAITVAVTGVAGPTGGTPDTPVGTVWLAVAMGEEARSWRLQIPGDRELVKWRASRAALNAIRLAAMYGKLPETIAQWMTPP